MSSAVEPPSTIHQPVQVQTKKQCYGIIVSAGTNIKGELHSPVTNATMFENAVTANSVGPSRPVTSTEVVWIEFWSI